jgi:predicted nucleotidyltransferase
MIRGRDNRGLMEGVRSHPDFRDFVLPIAKLGDVRDATFFLRNDGLLAFSEGYHHPDGRLIGNIIYVPDEKGTKNFFGAPYASVIKKYGGPEEEWVTFKEQLKIYRDIDQSTQNGKPVFAENKCVFDIDDFIGFVPPLRSLKIIRERSPEIDGVMRKTAALLDIDVDKIGCTGSMAFGNMESVHDFDLVFYGTAAKMREIVGRIYDIVKEPKRQVFEMGMLWAIRFYDDGGNMICPFFSYEDISEIPLPEFELEVVEKDVIAEVTVKDDTHTGFMPTYLPLEKTEIRGHGSLRDPVLIIYHGGKRGEYRKGDRVKARGYLAGVTVPGKKKFDSILVTDMEHTEKL